MKTLIATTALILATTALSACQTDASNNGGINRVDDDSVRVGPTTRLRPNAYGMGMSADQYGRAVRTDPLWQGESSGIFAPNGMVNIWE